MTTATLENLAQGTWDLDPSHTTVGFTARHLVAAKVRGSFKVFAGSFSVGDGLDDSSITLEIDAASIDTGVADRDGHLRSGDFLQVDEYPTISFRSTSVEGTPEHFRLTGDLTVKDVTAPVTLDANFHGVISDPWGNAKAIFSAAGKLNRETWGLTWNQPLETGGFLVGKEITLQIEAQATRTS